MNKKILVRIVGVVTMAMLTVILMKERSKLMKCDLSKRNAEITDEIRDYVEKAESVKVVPRDENGLSDADKRELKERFEGMSPAEIDIFMSLVPVELCVKRIEKELDKAKEFERTIKSAMSGLI